jgi:hypothetical protein
MILTFGGLVQTILLQKYFNELSSALRGMMDVPLRVVIAHGLSPAIRYTEINPLCATKIHPIEVLLEVKKFFNYFS